MLERLLRAIDRTHPNRWAFIGVLLAGIGALVGSLALVLTRGASGPALSSLSAIAIESSPDGGTILSYKTCRAGDLFLDLLTVSEDVLISNRAAVPVSITRIDFNFPSNADYGWVTVQESPATGDGAFVRLGLPYRFEVGAAREWSVSAYYVVSTKSQTDAMQAIDEAAKTQRPPTGTSISQAATQSLARSQSSAFRQTH